MSGARGWRWSCSKERISARSSRDAADFRSARCGRCCSRWGHALGGAHAQGIVHRDLKPENLFLARSRRVGQGSLIKVLDFGIAAVGSPFWMAPEQSRPGDALLPATDVWALGLIAFHLLIGRSYWRTARLEDASISAVLTEILMEPLESASARATWLGAGERVPAGFDAWFSRCVTRCPSASQTRGSR